MEIDVAFNFLEIIGGKETWNEITNAPWSSTLNDP